MRSLPPSLISLGATDGVNATRRSWGLASFRTATSTYISIVPIPAIRSTATTTKFIALASSSPPRRGTSGGGPHPVGYDADGPVPSRLPGRRWRLLLQRRGGRGCGMSPCLPALLRGRVLGCSEPPIRQGVEPSLKVALSVVLIIEVVAVLP